MLTCIHVGMADHNRVVQHRVLIFASGVFEDVQELHFWISIWFVVSGDRKLTLD